MALASTNEKSEREKLEADILISYKEYLKRGNSSLVSILCFLLQVCIYGLPTLICVLPLYFISGYIFKSIYLVTIPIIYTLLFVTLAGTFSLPFQRAIVKGIFPRSTYHPVYAMRKLYGVCWTSVYYFRPLYNIILNTPLLKAFTLRIFGYKGSVAIVLYPDAWIRDLPLLRIEDGVYIANLCALGTNVSLLDGNTMVGNVTLKKGALIGAVSKIGLGSTIGERTEISFDVITGLHVKIGNDTFIGARSNISHYARIGNNVRIGVCCFIGTKVMVGDNVTIPNNCHIPDNVEVLTSADVIKYCKV